jgi:hypothetical protein
LILSRQARHARRMTLHEAMEAILDRFCVEWSRPGEDASFDREALQLELMIPAEVFSEAIRVLVLGVRRRALLACDWTMRASPVASVGAEPTETELARRI